jgi:hypothetical protein
MVRNQGLPAVLAAVLLVVSSGCDRPSDQPPLAPVSGVVTMDGKPLAGKNVVFSPKEGRASMGRTNENGEYKLMYTNRWEGAIIGPHDVTILTPGPEVEGMPYQENVPFKYNVNTILKAEVEDTDNVIDFKLESK